MKKPSVGFLTHWSHVASIGLAISLLIAAAPHARAQNLVQDPNFFQGFQFYTTTGDVTIVSMPFGPTPPNSAEMIGPGAGDTSSSATITQAISTTPNTNYIVTFAVSLDPYVQDSFTASFGDGSKMLTQSPANGTGFDIFTFTGKSSAEGNLTDLTFTTDAGATLITELDVEAAPAPVTGGGLLSAGVAIVGFAVQRRRRKAAA